MSEERRVCKLCGTPILPEDDCDFFDGAIYHVLTDVCVERAVAAVTAERDTLRAALREAVEALGACERCASSGVSPYAIAETLHQVLGRLKPLVDGRDG